MMPFDGYQKQVEDAPMQGKGARYEGPPAKARAVLATTRSQLLAMAEMCNGDEPAAFAMDEFCERGAGGVRVHWHAVREVSA